MEKVNRNKEWIIYFLITMMISAFLIAISYYSNTRYVGDSALYGQITENIAFTGKAEGNIFANTQDFIDRHIGGLPIEQRINDESTLIPPVKQSRNILKFHCCLILYLIAPLCHLMSAFSCITLVQSVALALSLVFMISLMREHQIPVPIIILTCVVLISHPGWSYPAVYGAFYPERLFMGTGMYLIWACEKKNFQKAHFIISAILCLLVGERGALYAGMFILAHTVFYWKERQNHKLKLGIGMFLLIYAGVVTKLVLTNLYYSNLDIGSMFLTWKDSVIQQRIILFLIINVMCYLILGLFHWKSFVIAFCSMIPNLLYNVGGAEKIGWTLHYHVFYFVFLMWAVTKGIIKLYDYLCAKQISRLRVKCIVCIPAVAILLLINIINPFDCEITFDISNAKNNVIYNGIRELRSKYLLGGRELRRNFNQLVEENVSEDAIVTSVESGMVALDCDTVYYFPMGIEMADIAILTYTIEDEVKVYGGTVSYGASQSEQRYLDDAITQKMLDLGYDFDNASYFPEYGIAIVKKKQ